uniref:Uncharacterized protein n=1 Tax=Romanomermis culicivorax TaxID=13658 RepID=A0A915L4M4_ROMCU
MGRMHAARLFALGEVHGSVFAAVRLMTNSSCSILSREMLCGFVVAIVTMVQFVARTVAVGMVEEPHLLRQYGRFSRCCAGSRALCCGNFRLCCPTSGGTELNSHLAGFLLGRQVVHSLGILPLSGREVLGGSVCRACGSSIVHVLWALRCSTSSCC